MLDELLKERDYLPVLKMNDGTDVSREGFRARRREMLAALEKYSYGKTPLEPVCVYAERTFIDEQAYAGKVINERLTLSYETHGGVSSFPIEIFIPKRVAMPPVFLHLAFRPVPDRYIPVEEITDGGYALVVVCYQDIMNDNHFGDFSGGVAAHFGTTAEREREEWGKIGMWAYGASRVMDYLVSERWDELCVSRVAVVGHSRLGKTALWCAAQDERFAAAISNDSGYGGAASSKLGIGERISDFVRAGSWDWFCNRFLDYEGDGENEKPYDQAFLLSLIAPRYLLVSSAIEDLGADPISEFLTTLHASAAWELLGERGLVCEDRLPRCGDLYDEGAVGYHLRAGRHFLSREDWRAFMRFLDKKYGL